MKRYFILCLTLMALVLGGCRQSSSRLSTTPTPNASANTPTPQPTRAAQTGVTVLAEGQIVAVNPVLPLGFQTGGHLLTLAVQAGDTVAAGDLIATLADECGRHSSNPRGARAAWVDFINPVREHCLTHGEAVSFLE